MLRIQSYTKVDESEGNPGKQLSNYSGLPAAWLLTAYGSSPGVWSGCGLCSLRLHSPHPLQTWESRRRRRAVLN